MRKPEPVVRTSGVESKPMVITSHAQKTIVRYVGDGDPHENVITANGSRIRMEMPTRQATYQVYPIHPEGRVLLQAIADGINEVLAVPVVELEVDQ